MGDEASDHPRRESEENDKRAYTPTSRLRGLLIILLAGRIRESSTGGAR